MVKHCKLQASASKIIHIRDLRDLNLLSAKISKVKVTLCERASPSGFPLPLSLFNFIHLWLRFQT